MFSLCLLLASLSLSSARLQGWRDSLPLPTSAEEAAARGRSLHQIAKNGHFGQFDDGYATFTAHFQGLGFKRMVRPLGSCYQISRNGTTGSEFATKFTLLPKMWTVEVHVFDSEDCDSLEHQIELITMDYDGVYLPDHEEKLDRALELPVWASGGYLWTSYMTENGCEGNPACWEVGVTDCAVEDDIHDEAFTAVCNFTDDRLDVYIHNVTSDPTCEDGGEHAYHRLAECTEYPAMNKYSVNEDSPMYQTNTCLNVNHKGKPKAKKLKKKTFFDSIAHFFENLFSL